MWHQLLYLFVIYNLYNADDPIQIFIGQGSNHLYFTLRRTHEWDWGLNYCHTFRLIPASIETEEDHELITNFLNTSTSIEDENRFLWLPATDYRREGTFEWMWNMKEVVGSWAPGMPSLNRSANCMAINRFGQFIEESCHSSGHNYHTLCAAENFHFGIRDVSDINDFKNATISNQHTIIDNDLIHQEQLASLRHIGQVGNVMYFVNDQMISWAESLDLCHAAGMRLASPEQPDQFNFIQEFATQEDMIYHLGGTDRLSVSCAKSNTEFRWFHSGNRIANQTNFYGNHWWYLCTCLSPSPAEGIFPTGCAKGGGAFARTICEVSVQS